MNTNEKSLKLHEKYQGKIEVVSKVKVATREDLSLAYTPGVAEPCRKIHEEKELVYKYTSKGNMVAVVSDGSAVLGLGDIGPEAGLPVMEGKAILFKEFANVDAFPICLDTQDPEEIVKTVEYIAPVYGGINLEDISAPRCFEIEEKLKKSLNIPVFHDDQHGTAVVTLAGTINALKLVKKEFKDCRFVITGAGAAGIAIAKLLHHIGVKDIFLLNREGIICEGQKHKNPYVAEMAKITNKEKRQGGLKEAFKGTDVYIGVSGPDMVTKEMIEEMNKDAIVFAMANPIPEIMPEEAKAGGAVIIGTGRSDFPNQINNVLAFPGIFRGALDVRASDINEEMKIASAKAIANIITDEERKPEYVIPDAFDSRVVKEVAEAVAQAAKNTGVSRI
ncbi:malate dehydrogenase (oxaloacetate-decarboxylating) [Tindallia magadiensis]|uniref:Malate dehydrogenase (Oxaloacetate-decarboxylating) n=1 Tax=Tindallia magadiensis TaxID=69895 RepID=A0A1I3EWB1_9FIRM|nr:NADP-dependent malic enzyme [Tindallia magadiensis]SFI02841.1 malate dehydrogenase (oxaloacetate-decarboxylating) [Tindallia magadiensis]